MTTHVEYEVISSDLDLMFNTMICSRCNSRDLVHTTEWEADIVTGPAPGTVAHLCNDCRHLWTTQSS
jgi:hypothetical protein